MKKILTVGLGLIVGLAYFGFLVFNSRPGLTTASVNFGHEYKATTSIPLWDDAAPFHRLIATSTDSGANTVLGSVIITNPGRSFCVYDATSTVASWRGGVPTTTIACWNDNAPVGTYTFDIVLYKGLLVEMATTTAGSQSVASTTITYRP